MSFHWGQEAGTVLDPDSRGVVRVLGGPGTGKSALLIDVAAARIGAGADPESVLLLTGSGRIGTQARSALTTRLLGSQQAGPCRAVVREPLVRSVHGYAFAVLRLAAQRAGGPPPRLVTSAEQDAIIADLLCGELAEGAGEWPAELRAALGTAGFAAELRELLTRCAERGIDPQRLEQVGRRAGRPEWVAAGRFARNYEQVMLLRAAVGTAAPQATTPAVGAAELVGAALEALAADPELLADQRARVRVLLVDDAQQLDPQAALLVRVLAAGTDLTLLAGDPTQAVFGFRGAEPTALLGGEGPSVMLTASHRCAPAVAGAVSGIAGRLTERCGIDGTGDEPGSVTAKLAASAGAEAALIADYLRRAHLVGGVPWSHMAVIVRSVARAGAGLPHALARAGVPVAPSAFTGPLTAQPAAQALLTVLSATDEGLNGAHAVALLTGPIGRVDPVSLRRLRRTLRRADDDQTPREFGELLIDAIKGESSARLTAAQAWPLRRVRAVLDAAAASHLDGGDPRATLWAAWHRSGLQRRWLVACERSGPSGAQAGRDLDAVTALFDATDEYVARTAGASLRGLIDHLDGQQLPVAAPESAAAAEQVAVLSAHAALGHEWDLVVIAGVQEGLWPNTIPRGGVLGTQRLLDVLDGIDGNASMRAPLLAEERRLLVAAMGRARKQLLVTAVDGEADGNDEADIPSPFFVEIAQYVTDAIDLAESRVAAPRVLSAAAVVGRLRGVVCAPREAVSMATRDCAATQLARLAEAGVPGADPADWYGMTPVSTTEPMWSREDHPEHMVTLSPSSLQTLTDCPLRWLVERHGGTDPRDLGSTVGSVMHALIAEPASDESQLLAMLERAWQHLPFESRWYSDNELARHRAMIQAFLDWRAHTRGELTEVGVEVDINGSVDANVRLRGRVDRIERDAAGRLVIVDIKTGKTPVSKDDAQRHAQLGAYQLAVAEGLVADGDEPGGGRLVYLGKTGSSGVTEREQDPLTPELRLQWRERVRAAADATAGPQFIARVNDGCVHCPLKPSCPAHTGAIGKGAI